MTLFACAVAVIASFYILLTQGLAVLAARRTGVLFGKAPNRIRIERVVDTEFFDELLDSRTRSLRLPAFIAAASIIAFAWTLFVLVGAFTGAIRLSP